MKEQSKVLIMAKPGQVRDGLRALLHAIPGVDVVECPCDDAFNSDLFTEHDLTIVLISCNLLEEGSQDALRRLRAEKPKVRFIVLTEDVEQRQLARDAGVDQVLIKGSSAEKLVETVKQLLS